MTSMAGDRVEVAVVGYGGMGTHHCMAVAAAGGLQLRAVCDLDEARRAQAEKEHGVATCASFDEVMADRGIDLVVLVTPHDVHADQTTAALAAGKHVVVEKAMCMTVKEADEMIAAARRADRILTVHQNRREDSDYLTALSAMESGALGEVYRIEAACNYHGPQEGWRTQLRFGGGYLYDAGGHVADQLVQMTGSGVQSVSADLQKRLWTDTMDTETYANVQIRFANGITAEMDISGIMYYRKPRLVIMGEKAAFVAIAHENFGEADCRIHSSRGVEDVPSVASPVGGERMRGFYERVAAHLQGQGPNPVDPIGVRESIKILDAARRSAEVLA